MFTRSRTDASGMSEEVPTIAGADEPLDSSQPIPADQHPYLNPSPGQYPGHRCQSGPRSGDRQAAMGLRAGCKMRAND